MRPSETLAEEGARLGLEALALTDHDGFYGVVRFAEAARRRAEDPVRAELTLGITRPQNGEPDPEGHHLVVLADQKEVRLAGRRHQPGPDGRGKGRPRFHLDELAAAAGHWVVLTGCRKGLVPATLVAEGPAAAARQLQRLIRAFGRDRVLVELWDHGDPLDSVRNDALAHLATTHHVGCVATANAHYASPAERPLATALAAVRARRSLDELDPWLPAAAGAHLRSGKEQHDRFRRYPGVVEAAAEVGRALAFDLALVAPALPPFLPRRPRRWPTSAGSWSRAPCVTTARGPATNGRGRSSTTSST